MGDETVARYPSIRGSNRFCGFDGWRKKGAYYTFIRDITAAARRNTFAVCMHIS